MGALDLNKISPFVRLAIDSSIDKKDEVAPRVIFDYEIIYIMGGKAKITIENEEYHAKRGEVFFLKPKQLHSIEIDPSASLHQPHIHFDMIYKEDSKNIKISFKRLEDMTPEEKVYFREDICNQAPFDLPHKIIINNLSYFEELLFDIIHEFESKNMFYELSVQAKFINLLTYLLRMNAWDKKRLIPENKHDLMHIRNYLHTNFYKSITLKELEGIFNINRFYLSHTFKQAYGIAPLCYHRKMRFEKIKERLKYTITPITEIAHAFDYKDCNTFSRAFRNYEGLSPSAYRDKHQIK